MSKMRLIGKFEYCGQLVTLKQSEDELQCVAQTQGPYANYDWRGDHLSQASHAFKEMVVDVLCRTSSSDVWIYAQQKAPLES